MFDTRIKNNYFVLVSRVRSSCFTLRAQVNLLRARFLLECATSTPPRPPSSLLILSLNRVIELYASLQRQTTLVKYVYSREYTLRPSAATISAFFDRAPQVVLFSRTRRDFCYFSWEILSCASLRQAPYEAYGVYLLKECRATTTKFEKKQSELPQHWLSLTESAIFQARCPNAKFRSVSHSSRDARVRLLVALLLTLDNHV